MVHSKGPYERLPFTAERGKRSKEDEKKKNSKCKDQLKVNLVEQKVHVCILLFLGRGYKRCVPNSNNRLMAVYGNGPQFGLVILNLVKCPH